ncbi:MAG: DUF929 family protein [Conexivisphaerales archaeon]
MPKCRVCGKSFSTVESLEQHHRTVHPKVKFEGPKRELPRHFYTVVFIIIIVAVAGVGFLIYTQLPHNSNNPSILGSPISQDFYASLTGVSDSTLNSLTNVTLEFYPVPISGSPLNKSGLPEILYIGGDFCPYCAGLRWSLSIALSRFGNISGLEYMLSGVNDMNVSTVTFSHVGYTSNYISFVAIEAFDRQGKPLQAVGQQENQLWNQYDPTGSIPFLDIANQYLLLHSPYDPSILKGLSWEQIYSQLNNKSNPVTQQIVAGADAIITAICKVDGGKPADVCNSPYANVVLASFSPASPLLTYASTVQATYSPSSFNVGRVNPE